MQTKALCEASTEAGSSGKDREQGWLQWLNLHSIDPQVQLQAS
jgi:hypothetical protein